MDRETEKVRTSGRSVRLASSPSENRNVRNENNELMRRKMGKNSEHKETKERKFGRLPPRAAKRNSLRFLPSLMFKLFGMGSGHWLMNRN
jgi:hypothetical protein